MSGYTLRKPPSQPRPYQSASQAVQSYASAAIEKAASKEAGTRQKFTAPQQSETKLNPNRRAPPPPPIVTAHSPQPTTHEEAEVVDWDTTYATAANDNLFQNESEEVPGSLSQPASPSFQVEELAEEMESMTFDDTKIGSHRRASSMDAIRETSDHREAPGRYERTAVVAARLVSGSSLSVPSGPSDGGNAGDVLGEHEPDQEAYYYEPEPAQRSRALRERVSTEPNNNDYTLNADEYEEYQRLMNMGGNRAIMYQNSAHVGMKCLPQACLFVASLSSAQSDERLLESVTSHFQKWGTLSNVKVLKDWLARPYAFVQFEHVEDANRALIEAHNTIVDNRHIRVEQARVNRTLFIAKFNRTVPVEKSVQEVLEKFGPVENLTLLQNYQTGRPKGCGFVKYCYREDAIKAFLGLRHTHKWVVEWASNMDRPTTDVDKKSIFVGQLNQNQVTPYLLEQRFSRYGKIQSFQMVNKNPIGPNARPAFAFINYETAEAADRAVKGENSKQWLDRTIRVQFREITESAPTASPASNRTSRVAEAPQLHIAPPASRTEIRTQRFTHPTIGSDSAVSLTAANTPKPSTRTAQEGSRPTSSKASVSPPITTFPEFRPLAMEKQPDVQKPLPSTIPLPHSIPSQRPQAFASTQARLPTLPTGQSGFFLPPSTYPPNRPGPTPGGYRPGMFIPQRQPMHSQQPMYYAPPFARPVVSPRGSTGQQGLASEGQQASAPTDTGGHSVGGAVEAGQMRMEELPQNTMFPPYMVNPQIYTGQDQQVFSMGYHPYMMYSPVYGNDGSVFFPFIPPMTLAHAEAPPDSNQMPPSQADHDAASKQQR